MAESPVETLVEFSRLVSSAATPAQIMPVLVDVAVTSLPAQAAAVLQISQDRLELVASRGLPDTLEGWSTEADLIGPELGKILIDACGGAYASADVLPLVSGGDLFGVLVVFGGSGQRELAGGLADLAAVAAQRAASYAELSRSYEELRASRDALARTERLRLLGQMAGGISHDLKNILNPLALQLEVLKRRCERGDKDGILATVATMREVIGHGVDVVDRLRVFSKQSSSEIADAVDLGRVTATAIELSRPRVELNGVTLRYEPGETVSIAARASELTSAIVNLIANSFEAMTGPGTITVSTGCGDGGAWIEVADDGPGMPPDVQAQVFEPFFTTKPDGTGLGLAMVYAFVERYRGRVTLHSAPGEGTRIRLWFRAAVTLTS